MLLILIYATIPNVYNIANEFNRFQCMQHILTNNAPLILIEREFFFYAGKTRNWRFRGVFRGGQDLSDPHIVLRAAKDNFCVKRVEAPFEKPRVFADYSVFSAYKK